MKPTARTTRQERRAARELAEDDAAERQEANRHEEDALTDIAEDAEDARQDAADNAADRGD